MQDDIHKVLFSEQQIFARIEHVSREVSAAYLGRPLTVVCVLKGSCIFAADLIRRLPIPLELAFVTAESYRDGTEPGEIAVRSLPERRELEDRDVLLVDDILDTGRTLVRLRDEIGSRGARSVRTCVLLDKPSRRRVAMEADFSCFRIEDVFVVGYGLDFRGRYRNLPCVASLKPEILAFPSGSARASAEAHPEA